MLFSRISSRTSAFLVAFSVAVRVIGLSIPILTTLIYTAFALFDYPRGKSTPGVSIVVWFESLAVITPNELNKLSLMLSHVDYQLQNLLLILLCILIILVAFKSTHMLSLNLVIPRDI